MRNNHLCEYKKAFNNEKPDSFIYFTTQINL